jgi:hypothetical protein
VAIVALLKTEALPMRDITLPLPVRAKERLDRLTLERDASLDASRAAMSRISMLPRQGAEAMRDRLQAEHERLAERHRALALLLSRIHQWCWELKLPPGSVLEIAAVPDTKLRASETVAAAVASTRQQIVAVQQDISATRSRPMKRASQAEATRAYLARLAVRSQPKVGFDARGNASVRWVEDMATMDGVLGLLTFVLGPQAVASAFARELEQEPEPPNAVSPLEREKRLGELAQDLLALERKEAELLSRDESILPRPDMSPQAFLGVAIAQATAQVA